MRRRTRLIAAALALSTVTLGATGLVAHGAGAATAGCRVDYTVNQWPGGFTANLNIVNLGDPVNGWTLTFAFTAGQVITNGWNAAFTQAGGNVSAANLSYNSAIATNASVSAGFQASWTSANPTPAQFALNGAVCTGQPTTPPATTPPPTTPPPTTAPPSNTPPPADAPAPALHVSGNQLLTANNTPYRLLGVNRSGGEFACIQNNGFWDGPMDQASVSAIRTWKVRAVRVPLNEECWLATSDAPAQWSGPAYQQAVKDYVNLLLANGITPILEMHWSFGQYTGPGGNCQDVKATCQKPMPDAQFAPSFWTGVANAFKDNRIVFDLFNEPFPDFASGNTGTATWTCWRDGGTCAGISFQVAGFQSLLTAVRSTGNTNVVMIGGLSFSNNLAQWLQFKPSDPTGNLMAFGHVYNFNSCANQSCWDAQMAPVAASVPLTLSEIGENDCAAGFVNTLMNWADGHGVGYLGWTWNAWDCSQGPSLISDYTGTATPFGQGVKARLATVSS
jgi:endoglucanase